MLQLSTLLRLLFAYNCTINVALMQDFQKTKNFSETNKFQSAINLPETFFFRKILELGIKEIITKQLY